MNSRMASPAIGLAVNPKNSLLNAGMKRASSAAERVPLRSNQSRRANSARFSKPEPPPPEPELCYESSEEIEPEEEHRVGCPWRRRSRQMLNNLASNTGIVHPKPWGARNPKDIPCHCKSAAKPSDQGPNTKSRSPPKLSDLQARHQRQQSRQKVLEIISALCTVMDRKKVKLNDYEVNILIEMVKDKIQKYKEPMKEEKLQEQQKKQQEQGKQQQGSKANLRQDKSPTRRPRMAQSLAPTPPPGGPHQIQPVSRENLGDQQRTAPNGPVVGKLETKKYYIELRSDEQMPQGLQSMFGMMPDRQYVLMDPNSFSPSEEMRQYTVMNSGMQLRHHEENTTLLLGNQRIASPIRPKQPLSLPPQPALPANAKMRR